VAVKTGTSPCSLSLIWALLFTHRLFPNPKISNVIKRLLVGLNIFILLFVLLATPLQFTHYISVYLFTIGVVLFIAWRSSFRAWINERMGGHGGLSMLGGVFYFFAYDLFAYEGFLPLQCLDFQRRLSRRFFSARMAPAHNSCITKKS